MARSKNALSDKVRITAPMAKGESLPTLTKSKGIRALLLIANSIQAKPGDILTVDLEVLRDLLRCRDDEHLISEIEGLAGMKLNWERYDPNSRGYAIPVSSVRINKLDNKVHYSFDPQFLAAYLDNSTGFKKISWDALSEMRSIYAVKLYELAAYQFEEGQVRRTRKMSLVELREMFGVRDGQYPLGTFYQQVVRRAVDTVNQGRYGFLVEYQREGRGENSSHWFQISPAPHQQLIPLAVPVSKTTPGSEYLVVRVKRALEALPEKRREEVIKVLAKQGLGAVPDAGRDISYIKSYMSALIGEDIPVD